MSGLDESHKETPIISENFLVYFRRQGHRRFFVVSFLIIQKSLNFNEKLLDYKGNHDIFFSKIGLFRQKRRFKNYFTL